MKKNIPLADKIKFRMTENWKDFDLDKKLKSFISLRKHENQEKGYVCYYNHLTPNRNLVGFNYTFANHSNIEKVNKYYDNIYEYDDKKLIFTNFGKI